MIMNKGRKRIGEGRIRADLLIDRTKPKNARIPESSLAPGAFGVLGVRAEITCLFLKQALRTLFRKGLVQLAHSDHACAVKGCVKDILVAPAHLPKFVHIGLLDLFRGLDHL